MDAMIEFLELFLVAIYNLFHKETVCGKNEYLYTAVLAYGTNEFLSYDDLVAVMPARI